MLTLQSWPVDKKDVVHEKKQKQKLEQKHEASGLFVTSMFTKT